MHGSTHVARSTKAESTTSTEAESTASARRLRPLSFCPDSLEGFTAYPRYFEQRNYATYHTTPRDRWHHTTYRTAPRNLSHLTRRTLHNTSRVAPCTTPHASQLIAQHLTRRNLSHNTSRVAPCTLHLAHNRRQVAPRNLSHNRRQVAPRNLSHNTSRAARRNKVL